MLDEICLVLWLDGDNEEKQMRLCLIYIAKYLFIKNTK